MPVLNFPTLAQSPNAFEFGLVTNTVVFTSPLSGAVQTVEMPSPRWKFLFALNDLEEADAALVQAFFAQLRGQAGRFYMHNLARPAPRGVATGTPKVKGASQLGNTLLTDGWTPSTLGILKTGDFFSVNGELKMLVVDANTDLNGEVTLTFEPPLRDSPADNADIVTSAPKAVFKLTSDDNSWVTKPLKWSSFNIQGVEVF